ncbi:MAG: hypothetical protein PHT40_04055 [Patescibacteria group bacterium]|nr:hypothetical protein [Patescibacteria group bacterium]
MPNITPDFQTNPLVEKPKFHLPVWLALMIILTLAISAGALIYLFATSPAVQFSAENEVKKSAWPAVVNSYVGEITKIEKDNISLTASAEKNYLEQDTTLLVQITPATKLTILSLPKKISDPTQPLALTQKEIKFTDLKIGQTVVVFSVKSIKNQNTIVADSVEVQNIK